jgi:hypothetical protein
VTGVTGDSRETDTKRMLASESLVAPVVGAETAGSLLAVHLHGKSGSY